MYEYHRGYEFFQPHVGLFGLNEAWFLFIIIMLWSLVWKGWALWVAAKRGEKPWFIALLVLNTVGLLEIFYLFVIAKQSIPTMTPAGETTEGSEKTEEKENKAESTEPEVKKLAENSEHKD